MFGMSLHSTYKGHKIEQNGFGEYEVTLGGLRHVGIRTVSEVRHMIREQIAKDAVIKASKDRG